MANISNAYGTLQFNKDFFRTNKEELLGYLKQFTDDYDNYGFTLEKDELGNNNDGKFNFIGSGRWSMFVTWQFAFNAIEENQKEYQQFLKLLYDNKQVIVANYEEYESGMEIFGHFIDLIGVQRDLESGLYSVVPINDRERSEEYELNDYNVISRGFLEGCLFPQDKDKFVKYWGNEWYDNMNKSFKKTYNKEIAINMVIHAIENSPETQSGISEVRIDFGGLTELFNHQYQTMWVS